MVHGSVSPIQVQGQPASYQVGSQVKSGTYQSVVQTNSVNNVPAGNPASFSAIQTDYRPASYAQGSNNVVTTNVTTTSTKYTGSGVGNNVAVSSNANNNNNGEFKSYLDKIDEQLKESRKNFPTS